MKALLSTAVFAWLAAVSPVIAAGKAYVISDFGAVGDGATLNTKAIQAVIDRCAADGGGVVVVPKGTFSSGAIFSNPASTCASTRVACSRGPTNCEITSPPARPNPIATSRCMRS